MEIKHGTCFIQIENLSLVMYLFRDLQESKRKSANAVIWPFEQRSSFSYPEKLTFVWIQSIKTTAIQTIFHSKWHIRSGIFTETEYKKDACNRSFYMKIEFGALALVSLNY